MDDLKIDWNECYLWIGPLPKNSVRPLRFASSCPQTSHLFVEVIIINHQRARLSTWVTAFFFFLLFFYFEFASMVLHLYMYDALPAKNMYMKTKKNLRKDSRTFYERMLRGSQHNVETTIMVAKSCATCHTYSCIRSCCVSVRHTLSSLLA